jgi:hypothetical protein
VTWKTTKPTPTFVKTTAVLPVRPPVWPDDTVEAQTQSGGSFENSLLRLRIVADLTDEQLAELCASSKGIHRVPFTDAWGESVLEVTPND